MPHAIPVFCCPTLIFGKCKTTLGHVYVFVSYSSRNELRGRSFDERNCFLLVDGKLCGGDEFRTKEKKGKYDETETQKCRHMAWEISQFLARSREGVAIASCTVIRLKSNISSNCYIEECCETEHVDVPFPSQAP